jgi:integrase
MPGHIRKRGRSSWTVIVDLGNDPTTGKRRQLWRSVKGPKREAEGLLVQLLHERDTGVERPVGKLTVAKYLEQWMRDYVEPSLAPKTVATYRDVIRVHLVPALGSVDLVALRPATIQALYTALRGRLSPRSVLRYHQILHAALRQAVRWQLLIRNPADAVEPPRAPRRELRATTADQARAVMAAADATPYGSFVRLAFLTGARRGELLGLRWQDVDLEKGALHIQQTAQRIPG